MNLDELLEHFFSFDDRVLGVGGQKRVYRGVHDEFGAVVVKCVLEPSSRIDREIDIVRSHKFNNVPRIYEVLEVDWNGALSQVIIEEFVQGTSLSEIIREGHRYGIREVISFLRQGLAFLGEISDQGIVHRDIKPDNILVTEEGDYYFIDFGIARDLDDVSLTQTGAGSPLTPGYGAPELYTGDKDKIDVKVDLFSLGVVAYELVSGSNPFRPKGESNPYQIFVNTITVSPVTFHLEGDDQAQIMGFISAMMSKDRYRRPRDAAQAAEWLENVIAELPLEV